MFYQMPKNLSELEHFRSNSMVQFKEETVGGVEVVIPCYMIANVDFWKVPGALELRGHVFRKDTGELISAALPKFFNVGENEFTQKCNLPWKDIVSVNDKVDGSMITFALINDKVYAKTKKSFYSDVAKEAQKFIDANETFRNSIASFLRMKVSPVWEFYHPEWQVVLNYGNEPMMKYLGYREMNQNEWFGEWFPSNEHSTNYHYICDNLEKWQEETVDVEGVVIQFADGRVVKAKTKWYLQQHRVRTDLRERDVAELAALEKLDDVKSTVTAAGLDLAKIEVIEKSVSDEISAIISTVEISVGMSQMSEPKSAKEMADAYKEHPYFGMIMTKFRGKEPNYVEYFMRNILKEKYGLKNVYNEKF